MIPFSRYSLALCLALSLVSCADTSKQAEEAAAVVLPAPDMENAKPNPAKVIPQPEGATLKTPDGFKVEEYASGFKKPRFLLELTSGKVLVTDAIPDGSVYVIENGKPGKALLTGLERPFGMALWKDYLYVTEAQNIKRYRLNQETLEIGPAEVVLPLTGYTAGHWTRALAFDKNDTLYVGVGSGSNVGTDDPEDRNAVLAISADGANKRIVAKGLRNPVSVRIQPESGKLWATVQERDGLGNDLPPDFLTEVKEGQFYGWPWAYYGKNEDPRHKGVNPEAVAKTIVPDVMLPAHASAMDFIFYTGDQFPAKYRNGAFVAYRGSSGRAKRVGYSIEFVPFQNGKPAGKPEAFLSGFMLGEDQPEVWGRPVGIVQLSDGSILFSEDGNNKIYRVSYSK